ncbi:MAG: hypothetical protein AB1633_05630 [Elusimicrobiota bacterium]
MAELTTWSVKMTDDLKEKISGSLQESGLTGKEFMENLLNTYEQVKKERPEITPDLEELETITKRICNIYVNVGERMKTILKDKDDYHKTLITEKADLINTLQKVISELKTSLEEKTNLTKELEEEKTIIQEEKSAIELRVENENKQHTEINLSNKALIEEYKQKNDTLTGLLAEYETYKNQIQNLKKNLDQERDEKKEAQYKARDMEEALNKIKETLCRTEESYKTQIENIIEQRTFEKEKALLEQEKSLRNELQGIREEYNNKIKALLDEIEKKSNISNKTEEIKN